MTHNSDRIARAHHTLEMGYGESGELSSMVVDLLADLHHLYSSVGEDPQEALADALRVAGDHYRAECRMTKTYFSVKPYETGGRRKDLKGTVGVLDNCVELRLGSNAHLVASLEHANGQARLLVWASADKDEPTHIINLDKRYYK